MSNLQLRSELLTLSSKLSVSRGILSTAQSHASIPVPPNSPAVGLTTLAEAVSAQQDALDHMLKILEKMS
ncbi:MAG: hypothetical protein EA352_03100 [Gemmatimonadales bacterium]|nr:MAG: hypothetical protein EA352_03100 [Gemmatimonadales bacterium]